MTNEEAIKWLENLQSDLGNPHYECLWPYAQAIEEIKAKLAKPEPDWIKCTPDTMPETNDEVLTTYIVNGNQKRRYVKTASWFHDGEEGHWNSVWDEYRVPGTRDEVLAWMPMPKPYRD